MTPSPSRRILAPRRPRLRRTSQGTKPLTRVPMGCSFWSSIATRFSGPITIEPLSRLQWPLVQMITALRVSQGIWGALPHSPGRQETLPPAEAHFWTVPLGALSPLPFLTDTVMMVPTRAVEPRKLSGRHMTSETPVLSTHLRRVCRLDQHRSSPVLQGRSEASGN